MVISSMLASMTPAATAQVLEEEEREGANSVQSPAEFGRTPSSAKSNGESVDHHSFDAVKGSQVGWESEDESDPAPSQDDNKGKALLRALRQLNHLDWGGQKSKLVGDIEGMARRLKLDPTAVLHNNHGAQIHKLHAKRSSREDLVSTPPRIPLIAILN